MNFFLKISIFAVFVIFANSAVLLSQNNIQTTEQKGSVSLTPEERAWLDAHPEIVLGYTDAFEPDVIVNWDGSLRGIQIDFLDELNRRLGTRIGLKIYPVPELIKKAQNKGIDGIISLHPDYADKLGLLKTSSHFINYPAVFSRKDMSFDNPSDLSGKRVAIIDKVFFSEQIIEQYGIEATILKVLDTEEGLQLIDNGQADFFLGATLNSYLITKYQLFNLAIQYVFYNTPIHGIIGIRPDWPEFSSILDKGLSSFSRDEFDAIIAKWSNLSEQPMGLLLSDEENAWLAQNHTVRVRVVDHPPFMILDESQPRGISIEYLEYIARYTGINFQYVEEIRPFDQAYQSMQKLYGPDLIQNSQVEAEQMAKGLFSRVYFSAPYVIYMRNNADFISGIEGLAGKTIAIPGDSLLFKQLLAQVSDSNLVRFDSNDEALKAVSSGKTDAYIGNLTEASYYIQEYNISNLKIAAPSLLSDEACSFGIRPDWPELATLINKVLDNMSSEDRAAIHNKYVAIQFHHGIDIAEVRLWGGIGLVLALIIILIVLYWNRSLRKLVEIRTSILAESESRFRATFEQAAVGIAHVSLDGHFLRINQRFCDIVGYTSDEMLELTFKAITHPDDLDADAAEVQRLLDDEKTTYSMEKRYIRKDKHNVWVNLTVSLVRDKADAPAWFVSVIDDISERKRAENTRKETEEKFRAVVDQSPIAIQIHGLDGKLITSNAAWRELNAFDDEVLAEVKEKYNILEDEQARELGIMPSIEKVYAGASVEFPLYSYTVFDTLENLDFANSVPMPRTRWIQTRGFPLKDEAGRVTSSVFMSMDITEQKLAEMALQESESRFRATFEQAAVGIAHVSLDGGFLRINQRFCDIVGYTQGEMLSLTFQDITHPDDMDADVAEVQRLLDGEKTTYSMEKRYIRKDKHHVWVNLTASLVRDEADAQAWFVAVVDDITERKKMTRERDCILNQSQDMICIAGMDGYFKYLNPSWEKVLGYSQTELLSKPFIDFVHPDDQVKTGAELENLKSGKMTLEFENRYIHKNRSICHIDWTAVPLLDENVMYCIGRNITERKETENNLNQLREYTDNLIETANVMIVSLDNHGQVQHFNPAAEKITGYTLAEITGKSWFKLLTPPDRYPKVHEEFNRIMKGGLPKAFENPILTKSGKERYISWANSEIKQGDKITGITSFGIDITERKQTELDLAKSDEALKDSEEKFRHLMEQAPISIQIHTPDGRLLQSNAAYARLYALNEQILEELYEKYNVLDDEQARNLGVMPYIEKVFAGEDSIFPDYIYDGVDTLKTLDFKTPVSRKVWIQTRGYPVKNKDGKIINTVFMSEDITDRKLAEEALRESEEKFRHLVEQSPFSIQIFNTDGYLDQVNEAFMKLWGVTEETLPELLGKYNVLEDEEAQRLGISNEIRRAFNGDLVTLPLVEYDAASTFADIGIPREGGNKRWILPRLYPLKNARGEVVKVVDLEEDITVRKYAEEKYRVLVEQAQDGIVIVRDGNIMFINPYLAKLQGYTQEEIIGTPFTEYICPDEIKKVTEIYQLRMSGKPVPQVYESALINKNGARIDVEFNAAVIVYEGYPADLVLVRDITERKRTEQELLQYQSRLQSLGAQLTLAEEKERRRIATDLHDQIGQLLASSRFQLAAMINKIDDSELAGKLENVSGNLRQAVDDTRNIISELSSPLLNELGFESAVSEWLEENVQNRFEIKTSFTSNTKHMEIDEDIGIMLYRSVRELLTNVIKHARATKVDVTLKAKEQMLKLTISDNGIGFKYDPQRVSFKGTGGLGLFSIRERMSDLGGTMTVKSTRSKGTEVTLITPMVKKVV